MCDCACGFGQHCKTYINTFSTVTMMKHLQNKHEDEIAQLEDASMEEKILDWIIKSLVPFHCVSSTQFQRLFDQKIPSANTFIKNMSERFEIEKQKIKKKIQKNSSKFSFSHDIWTGVNGKSYLGIVTIYINDDYQLETFLLGLKEIEEHTGKNISELFCSTLQEYGIHRDKVGFVTTDNASNNDTFIVEFGRRMKIKNPVSIHIRCLAHIINLVVRAFLDQNDNEDEPDISKKWPAKGEEKKLFEEKTKVFFINLILKFIIN